MGLNDRDEYRILTGEPVVK